ncbi:hypothetical protein C8J56DRAFT_863611 [Mycena floridula]|nr:hypothetical protein C8J56DRAFT_863611 [Mycena floridula]
MRGDRGGENIEVSVWMIKYRGLGRASFMWGSLTRNTRIERLWVEVGTQFARRWRGFFQWLQRIHSLNHKDLTHLWLLHCLFLESINQDCKTFQAEWNLHPMSGDSMKNQSLLDMRFISRAEHGVDERQEGVHRTVLDAYHWYGVEGQERAPNRNQTGAGHPPDEDLDEHIANMEEGQVRHDAIDVPKATSPFTETGEQLFWAAFQAVQENNIVPAGYCIQPDEWESFGGSYPKTEQIPVGARKKVQIELPVHDWYPRACTWVQALELMNRFIVELQ